MTRRPARRRMLWHWQPSVRSLGLVTPTRRTVWSLGPEFESCLKLPGASGMVTVTPREPRYPFDGPRNCRDKRRLRASPFVTSPHSFDLSCHDSDSDSDSESESAAKVRVGQGHESGGSLGPADLEFIFNGSL